MINNLGQLKDTLKESSSTWAWVGQRGVDALMLLDFVSVDAGFCCDFGEAYPEVFGGESLKSQQNPASTGIKSSTVNASMPLCPTHAQVPRHLLSASLSWDRFFIIVHFQWKNPIRGIHKTVFHQPVY